ncbi:glycosyltransferase [Salarchaeum japonicum]|uniref:glycosyltransferase n=1 Tax=Salarchaeum japonicum TaxID=555573 RepID=UPI003C78FB59
MGQYELITVTAVVFGTVWTGVNFYHLYPFVQFYIAAPVVGASRDVYARPPAAWPPADADLPSIDVLIPAYEEPTVISQSVRSVLNADYPGRLTVTVLLEPDDNETMRALDDIKGAFDRLVVPADYPGEPNKPRALNYGFAHTDGDVVGVVDAEDIVDPDVFRAASYAFVTTGVDYAQGKLDMVNEGDGWRNLVFRAEYAYWYRLLLPAFHYVGYPVPLGGTTNFVRRTVLENVSHRRQDIYDDVLGENAPKWVPWGPQNVTEDFELGLFLWLEGYDLALLDVTTREESPVAVNAWVRQRTRWQKGKVYTFVQYIRNPPSGLRARIHTTTQSILPHLAPVNIAGIVILAMVANAVSHRLSLGIGAVLSLSLAFAIEMLAVYVLGYVLVSERRTTIRAARAPVVALATLPYWVLLWGAELRAMKQTYLNDHTWEKTAHQGRNR